MMNSPTPGTISSPPVISVVGKSGSGKTTLLERLIPVLARRGLRVGTIKHDAHRFEMDHPGKDTYRHFAAGASLVMIASAEKLALQRRLDAAQPLPELVERYMTEVDLVLTEGFKSGDKPKIEVFRKGVGGEMLCGPGDNLVAVVSDTPVAVDCPVFGFGDIEGVAEFIVINFVRRD
jgi:molybdopterin-guanine dinucleotide biosynthesis protein B